MRNPLNSSSRTGSRGAALILEIIIYLVVVSLIAATAVMVSGPLRDLTFTTHARTDIKEAQYWLHGKYAQDNQYPNQAIPNNDEIRLTRSGGFQNTGMVKRSDSGKDWCVLIVSARMADRSKARFWTASSDPNKIIQSSTSADTWSPASGVPDLQCPGTVS